MNSTVIADIAAAGEELEVETLTEVVGGRRANQSTSSQVIDIAGGWCGTDADF